MSKSNQHMISTTDKLLMQPPAISIIAPMYNVEQYVGQCLDSILSQTFENYEVIIVDDCSKDKSITVVESYIPKFEGRLKLFKLKKNSGGAGIPRNLAIKLSRGEYIANIDSDDMFTKTALEDFFNVAKETNADVVHAERHYVSKAENINAETPLEIESYEKVEFVKKPTLETENIAERIVRYINGAYWGFPWTKFCRRDFLIENNIEFPAIMTRDDLMFCFQCFCLAKKYVRIPNIVNIYRLRDDSHSHPKDLILDKHMNKWVNDIIEGVKFMDTFMNNIDVLAKNPELRYAAIDHFMQEELNWYMNGIYSKVPPHVLDGILRNLFSTGSNDNSALMSYIFNSMNVYRLNLIRLQQQVAQLQQQNKELMKKLQSKK